MSLPKATSRSDLIKQFRRLGWEGPYSGGKHEFMVKGNHKVRIPNPHRGDIGVALLSIILDQANITYLEWESAE